MTKDPARSVGIIVLGLSILLATAGVANALTTGFSATTYATLSAGTSAGIAFVGPVMYSLDSAGGGLYRTTAANTTTPVSTIPGNPTSLAVSGAFLYATRRLNSDIIQIDPLTGVFTTIADSSNFGGLAPQAMAADPLNGDLFVVTASALLYVIHTPAATPTPAFVRVINASGPSIYGMTVAADHSVYATVTSGAAMGVWQVLGPNPGPIGTLLPAPRGVGVIPGYLFVNNADGSITKIVIPGVGTGPDLTALISGAPGDLAAVGSDGCFYASQGPTVVRLANVDLTCNIGTAAPPPSPPTLILDRTSATVPHVGIDQAFSAQFHSTLAGADVVLTFTVTRGTSTTLVTRTTGPNGQAAFSYSPASAGIDVITASGVIGGSTITSNPITLTWLPEIVSTQPTTLTITSLPQLPQGATIVTAKLLGPGGAPIAGRTVKFTAGLVTASGVTNASGIASATLGLKPGTYALTASFAGDRAYVGSTATATLKVIAKSDDDGKDKDGKDKSGDGKGDGKSEPKRGTTRASG